MAAPINGPIGTPVSDPTVATPPPAPEVASTPSEPQVPMEDRILTIEETKALLRGVEPPKESAPDDEDPGQAQMVQEFFGQAPAQPPAAPPTPPPGLQAQAVQQTMQPPAAAQPVPAQQVPVQQGPNTEALIAQNQLLQQQIAMMTQQMTQMQQAPQPAPQAQAPQQAPGQVPFQFNVPDDYMNALGAEDINVRRSALNGLLNGVANSVAQQVRQEMLQMGEQIPRNVFGQISEREKARSIQQDIYGTYPELQQYQQYVGAAAMSLAQNVPFEAWNPELRDAIAERVAPMIPGLQQKIANNRAQRMGYAQPQGFQPQPAGMPPRPPQPQYFQNPIPPPLGYGAQPQGVPAPIGVHGGPVYTRDATGALVPYQAPQQFVQGQQTRPGIQAVPPHLLDMWSTLGYM